VEFIAGFDFLGFCDQMFIKNCPGFDGYEVVTASKSERTVRVFEKVMDKNNVKTHFVINLKTKFNFIK